MSGYFKEVSITPNYGATSQKIALAAATSAASTAFAEECYVLVTVKADTFMRTGAPGTTPTAVVDVDQLLVANNAYRVGPLAKDSKLAFISTPGGDVFITPQA